MMNHKILGGDVVNLRKLPQRKPNKTMTGKQLLNKAVFGTHKGKTEAQIKNEEIKNILK